MTSLWRRPLWRSASRRRSMVRVRICIARSYRWTKDCPSGEAREARPERDGTSTYRGTLDEACLLRGRWDEALLRGDGLTMTREEAIAEVSDGSRKDPEADVEHDPGAADVAEHGTHCVGIETDPNGGAVRLDPKE